MGPSKVVARRGVVLGVTKAGWSGRFCDPLRCFAVVCQAGAAFDGRLCRAPREEGWHDQCQDVEGMAVDVAAFGTPRVAEEALAEDRDNPA